MSEDSPAASGNPGPDAQPRRSDTDAGDTILKRLAPISRLALLVAFGLGFGVLALASSQQVGTVAAVAVPTPAPATVEQAAEPVAALALAEAATPAAQTPLPIAEAISAEAPGAGAAEPALTETLEGAATEPAADAATPAIAEPVVDQDELVSDLRAQLSARGGRRDAEEAPTSTPAPTEPPKTLTKAQAVVAEATPRPATKTPTPKPALTPKPAPTKAPTPRPTSAPAYSGALGQRVVSIALRYVGYRYRAGGTSPSTGFDCSGFAYFVYRTAGYPLSRDIFVQYRTGAYVARSALMPGDLVFFQNTYRYGLSHVAIYIGGGRIVHAQSETTGVTTSSLGDRYWTAHYLGARRP